MRWAGPEARIAFVGGFALALLGLVVIVAGRTVIGLVLAVIGAVVLLGAIVTTQAKAPAVREDDPDEPLR